MKKICCLCLFFLMSITVLTPVAAEQNEKSMLNLYVSVDGDDANSGTEAAPFKSLFRAQEEVRKHNRDMTGDIIVNVLKGTYCLPDTLHYAEQDSGSNGFNIVWRGADDGETVISGGMAITDWVDEGNGTWYAKVEGDVSEVRDLYIGGEKRPVAKVDNKIRAHSFYTKPNSEYAYDGIVVDSSLVEGLENPEAVTLHSGSGWMCHVIPMTEFFSLNDTETVLLFKQPMFNYITPKGKTTNAYDFDYAMKLENAKIFMNQPGEFYFEKPTKRLYYIPKSGERPESTVAYIPRMQDVVKISGSNVANKVQNIRFENLTFAHGKWDLPFTKGFSSVQGQWIVVDDEESIFTPSNITLSCSDNITFENNVFYGMGGVALGIQEAASNTEVVGNAFYDCKDSAVSLGLTSHSVITPTDPFYDAAYQKSVTASSELRPSKGASRATDYLLETAWQPSADDRSPWITVDLEEKTQLDSFEIALSAGDFEGGRVLVSNDPSFQDYETATLTSQESYEVPGAFKVIIQGKKFHFKSNVPGQYRYVRVEVTVDCAVNQIKAFDHSKPGVPEEETCKNTLLSNNYITRVGDYFWSSPAIMAYYVEKAEITQNHLSQLPYSGISLGWGWDSWYPFSDTARENKITNNYIDTVMTENFDGGAIYTIGNNPGSYITGNYIRECRLPFGAIYLDTASTGFTVTDNVLENVGRFFFCNPSYNIVLEDNYATTALGSEVRSSVNPVIPFAPKAPPYQARNIMEDAGLEDSYLYLLDKVPTVDEYYSEFGTEGYLNVLDQMGVSGVKAHLLNREITTAESTLKLIDNGKVSVTFPQEAIDAYRDMYWKSIGVVNNSGEAESGRMLYDTWISLQKAYQTLYESRSKTDYSSLRKEAETACNAAQAGDKRGEYPADAIRRLKHFLYSEKPYLKSGDAYYELEQAYRAFREEQISLSVTDVEVSGGVKSPVIDEANSRIELFVENAVNLKNMKPIYKLGHSCSLSKQSEEWVDYSSPVTIVVKNEAGTDYRFWTVIVKKVATE